MTESTGIEKKQKSLRVLSSGDLSIFCLQLSLILKAGIPLHEGLTTLGDRNNKLIETKQKIRGVLGKAVDTMADSVELGAPLHSAMKQTGVFPDYVLSMVEIGEGTGKLDNVLESLGEYYEKEQYLKTKIRNSLMYPVFLFIIMSVVIVLLVSQIFPIFKDMLEKMGGSLSAGEQAMADFSRSLATGEYTMYIILALSVIFVLIAVLLKTGFGKHIGAAFIAAFPLTRNINKKIAASRFANAMAMTLSSGMDFSEAMHMAVNLIDNDNLRHKFETCMREIDEGASFSTAIAKTDIFSGMYIKFIEIGQKTGSVDSVMKKISDICDTEADTSINNVTSVIEPLLVGILSIIIGIILVSVMIPLVNVMSSIA
jgi:type IV pilus assembly protein PilC